MAIFLLFLHIRGHRFLEKWLTTFLRNTGLKFVVDCTNGVANEFKGALGCFEGKKFFFWKLAFFDFFCISGVTDFLKNDQLLFWEIPAWNFSWTAKMVLRTNFKAFKVVASEKKFFQKFEIFWLFEYSGSQISWKMTNFFFLEIPTWNLSWTAQMVLQTNFKAF